MSSETINSSKLNSTESEIAPTKVRLKSFNGTTNRPIARRIRDCDDYWKLIGFEGQIIADEEV